MEADVEALLVNRVGHVSGFAAPEYYLLPIDECYKLVGLIRANWRGVSGGTEVWQEVGRVFAGVKPRGTVVREEANACPQLPNREGRAATLHSRADAIVQTPHLQRCA